jgi:hypothetical protein
LHYVITKCVDLILQFIPIPFLTGSDSLANQISRFSMNPQGILENYTEMLAAVGLINMIHPVDYCGTNLRGASGGTQSE